MNVDSNLVLDHGRITTAIMEIIHLRITEAALQVVLPNNNKNVLYFLLEQEVKSVPSLFIFPSRCAQLQIAL